MKRFKTYSEMETILTKKDKKAKKLAVERIPESFIDNLIESYKDQMWALIGMTNPKGGKNDLH